MQKATEMGAAAIIPLISERTVVRIDNAAQAVRASGRKELPASSDPESGRCPLLGRDDRCTIYAGRPFGCRTHFCAPAGGPIPRKALQQLIHRLEAIAESLGQTDPRPLENVIADALVKPPRRRRG